jgi:hypothetical protein
MNNGVAIGEVINDVALLDPIDQIGGGGCRVEWSHGSSKYIYCVDCRITLVGPKIGHSRKRLSIRKVCAIH